MLSTFLYIQPSAQSLIATFFFVAQHLEHVIKSRIPGIQSLINKTVSELETELSRLGKPIAADAGVRLCILLFLIELLAINIYLLFWCRGSCTQ